MQTYTKYLCSPHATFEAESGWVAWVGGSNFNQRSEI